MRGSAPAVTILVMDREAGGHRLDSLTAREREVLGLMAEGRSNTGIADALHLSHKTVEAHVRAIFIKLGLPPECEDRQHRRVQAVLAYLHDEQAAPNGKAPADSATRA